MSYDVQEEPEAKGDNGHRCSTGKYCHQHKSQAERNMKGLRMSKKERGLHCYVCEICRFWHVGHVNSRDLKKNHVFRPTRRRKPRTENTLEPDLI